MQLYYATVIGGYAVKQTLPPELAGELTIIHSDPEIELFRYPEGGLWVSLQVPGVRTLDVRDVNHIIIRRRGSDTFWGMDIVGPKHYETRLFAIKASAPGLLEELEKRPMMTDYATFRSTLLGDYDAATANDGPVTQWTEIYSLEQDQSDHTVRHRTAMECMAARREKDVKSFLQGWQLCASMFESLLRRNGLWENIPTRTKAFIGRQLSTITREGVYSYEPDDCHRGNPMVAALALRLAESLETGIRDEPNTQPVDWYAYQIVKVSASVRDYDGDEVPVWQWYDSEVIAEGKMRVVNKHNIAAALRRHGIVRPKGQTNIASVYGYDDCLYEVCAKRDNKPLFAVYVDDETIRDKEARLTARAEEPRALKPEAVNF